jgi:hypothetical protein
MFLSHAQQRPDFAVVRRHYNPADSRVPHFSAAISVGGPWSCGNTGASQSKGPIWQKTTRFKMAIGSFQMLIRKWLFFLPWPLFADFRTA